MVSDALKTTLFILTLLCSTALADDFELRTLNNEMVELRSQGDFGKALELAKKALAMTEQMYPGNHMATAQALNNLAVIYKDMGRYEEAIPLSALPGDARNPVGIE